MAASSGGTGQDQGPDSAFARAVTESAEAIKTKYVQTITIVDPDSGGDVPIEIRKLETGAMVGIDASYLEQDVGPVYSPYDDGVRLEIPYED